MKYLILLVLLTGCGPDTPTPQRLTQNNELELIRYYDKDHGVICYRVSRNTGLSCLQIK